MRHRDPSATERQHRDSVVGVDDCQRARAALTLIHQLVKELDWVRMLANRLPERLGDEIRAHRDAERIGALATDLAARARAFLDEVVTDGVQRPRKRPLRDLVDGAIRSVSGRFGGVTIHDRVPSELALVSVDSKLQSVLVDLLDNASRATADGASVYLRAAREGDLLEIALTDEGCGMSADAVSRCFEPGFSTRHEKGGHGLGLALSRATIAAIGGVIEIQSAEGRGTRVLLRFPVSACSAAA